MHQAFGNLIAEVREEALDDQIVIAAKRAGQGGNQMRHTRIVLGDFLNLDAGSHTGHDRHTGAEIGLVPQNVIQSVTHGENFDHRRLDHVQGPFSPAKVLGQLIGQAQQDFELGRRTVIVGQ